MKSNTSNKIFKNFSYLGIVQLLNYVFPIITIPIVARILGLDNLGLVNYIFSYAVYFSLIVNYSFGFTAVRKYAETRDINYVFGLVFSSQCYLFLVSTIFFIIAFFIIHDLKNNYELALISYLAVITVLFEKNWVFQVFQDLKMLAIINLLIKILTTILIVVCVKEKNDYIIYALTLNGITFLATFFTFLYCQFKYEIKWRFQSIKDVWYCLKAEKILFYSGIVISLYTTTNIVLLGYFSNVTQVGLYTAAQKILDIGKMFVILPVTQIIFPIVSQKIKENETMGVNYVRDLMPIFMYSSIVLVLGTVIFGPLIVIILYGHDFILAIPVLLILSISSFFSFFSAVFGILIMINLSMDGKFLKNQILVAFFSIFSLSLILPYGGAITTAIILVLSEFFITSYQFYYLKSKGYHFLYRKIFSIKQLKKSYLLLRRGNEVC